MPFKNLSARVLLALFVCLGVTAPSTLLSQRMVISADSSTSSPCLSRDSNSSAQTEILKTYPDGTKKIVPLAALNYRDEGKAFGGPPQLSLYSDTPGLKSTSERLSIAPIGTETAPAAINGNLPASPDPMAASTSTTFAGDPMGGGQSADPMGGGPVANPLGGGSAPVDPLSGIAPKGSPPPLQTVSGKPAPVSSAENAIELGNFEDFFLNLAIGGSIQGQLTSRRVFNGTNMQAYPTPPFMSQSVPYNQEVGITGENFTFQPGFRFDTEFGYNIYDWLGVSLQTGIIYNAINQYNVTFADGDSYHNSANGELVQVPVQLDGILRWPGAVAFKPFIGGGVGAIWQQLDVNNFYIQTFDVQGNYCRSAFQFGFNAQVGANYTVSPGVDFYGVFKLLGAFTPRIGNYDFENSYNFALEVGIQSRF